MSSGVWIYFVCGKAIVQFNDTNLISTFTWSKPSILKNPVGTCFGHLVTNHGHGATAFKSGRTVSRQVHSDNLNCLILKSMFVDKILRSDYAWSSTILQETIRLDFVVRKRERQTDVGLHMNLVSWSVILGAALTCSTLQPSRNWEYGLFIECLWFFEAETIVYSCQPDENRITHQSSLDDRHHHRTWWNTPSLHYRTFAVHQDHDFHRIPLPVQMNELRWEPWERDDRGSWCRDCQASFVRIRVQEHTRLDHIWLYNWLGTEQQSRWNSCCSHWRSGYVWARGCIMNAWIMYQTHRAEGERDGIPDQPWSHHSNNQQTQLQWNRM